MNAADADRTKDVVSESGVKAFPGEKSSLRGSQRPNPLVSPFVRSNGPRWIRRRSRVNTIIRRGRLSSYRQKRSIVVFSQG
jgi:cytochrome P450